MNTFTRVIATLSLLFVVAACGDTTDDSAGSSPGPKSTESTGSSSESDVVSVSLRRTGGLKPTTVNMVFSADSAPPKGHTPADVTAVLDAARAFTTSGAKVTAMPSNSCCDRYTYAVTITFADGTSSTYTTLDGLDQPRPFDALLSHLG